VSAVVAGTRLATAETGDATINLITWSTPSDTWSDSGTNIGFRLAGLPDGPGTYSLPADVSLGSFVQQPPLAGCGRPTGTIVVRDLVRAAGAPVGHLVRLDASVTATCHGGAPLAGEIRVGVAGAPYPKVTTGYLSGPRTRSWVGLPSAVTFLVFNPGPPAALATPIVSLDGLTATSSLSTNCTASLATSARCEVTVTFTPTTAGTGTAGVTLPGVGLLGSTVLTYPVTVLADTTPPVVTPLPVPAFVDRQDWIAGAPYTDAESGETTEDARARVAKSTATALSDYLYPKAWQGAFQGIVGSDAGQAVFGFLPPGQEYCISYRARDGVGNVSAWTPEQCRTLLWDDTVLTTNQQGWTVRINNNYYTGTYTTTTTRGSMLTGPYVNARRIAVLATTCASCGSVDVYVGNTRVGSLSLHSRGGHNRVVLQVPLRSKPIAGRLHIVVTSSGRPVYIDGIGASLT
jgi:hypothetical protein